MSSLQDMFNNKISRELKCDGRDNIFEKINGGFVMCKKLFELTIF